MLSLSFGGGNFKEPGDLRTSLEAQLHAAELQSGVASAPPGAVSPYHRLTALLEAVHEQRGERVAVLVDDYDKPIFDALDVSETARANRDFLCGFYGAVKESDPHISFSLFTGVTKFSTGSLSSDLNNPIDITLDPEYSAICGYTAGDLDHVFGPEMAGLDRDEIRDWYSGYRWLGEEVCSPLDILLLFRRREFGAYWFETGDPSFLIETLVERGVTSAELDGMPATADRLSTLDLDDIATEALLFLKGYLTIAERTDLGGDSLYRLGYPNRAVRQSLNQSILHHLVGDGTHQIANSMRRHDGLGRHDFRDAHSNDIDHLFQLSSRAR